MHAKAAFFDAKNSDLGAKNGDFGSKKGQKEGFALLKVNR
jgi:hypothetical protein